jgi:hypothetical protein
MGRDSNINYGNCRYDNCRKNIIDMCWKKKVEPIVNTRRQLISFACNNYPGTGNDLNGCINDQDDLIDHLPGAWAINTFQDSHVTCMNFHNTIKNYIVGMNAGDLLIIQYSGHGTRVPDHSGDEADGYDEALYLYDGVFTDDEFNELMALIPEGAKVIVVLDSCFSGTGTRNKGTYYKSKFVPYVTVRELNTKVTKNQVLNHIVFSGCKSNQTSADAFIDGRYNGAFTYFWLRSMDIKKTYRQWIDDTIYKLYVHGYEQIPTLEGPDEMLDELIFC